MREIFTYIAEDSPNAAARLLARLKENAALLQENPQLGRNGRVNGTRELVVSGTSYILPYRVIGKQIQVLAVFHASRKWPDNFQN